MEGRLDPELRGSERGETMLKGRTYVAGALSLSLWAAGHAGATPINPVNPRPVPVGVSGGEPSLQSILNGMYEPDPHVINDQSGAGMWGAAVYPPTAIPTMVVEYAGNAETNEFGIWFGTDTGSLFHVDLFLGPASGGGPNAAAGISFYGNTLEVTGSAVSASPSTCGEEVNCGVWTDPLITASAFGFYMDVTSAGQRYYTVDQLNGGTARAVTYQFGSTTNWAIAFEDGGDFDYNDMVVKVESLAPVPEPTTLVLLGGGLVAASLRRRRKS
jgi:hypothetical protein